MLKKESFKLFVTCPAGFETLLKVELEELGISDTRETVTGVFCSADHQGIYTICLWSRLANRVLMMLAEDKSGNSSHISSVVRAIDWETHIREYESIRVDFSGRSSAIRHSQYGAQIVKDGVVDRMQSLGLNRPNVDLDLPDHRINVRLTKHKLYVTLDLSGDSLHKRGYRGGHGLAPLKENLAAAILLRAKWPEFAKNGNTLLDPMCGSGTFLIEAAMMHADIAPGILRKSFGFQNWKCFQSDVWATIFGNAQERKEHGLNNVSCRFVGCEIDWQVAEQAIENIERAGLSNHIEVAKGSLDQNIEKTSACEPGLIVCNPPYGLRIGDKEALPQDYLHLANLGKAHFAGWRMAVLSSNSDLLSEMRMRHDKKYKFFNGPLACELRTYDIREVDSRAGDHHTTENMPQGEGRSLRKAPEELSEGAKMVANRISKNLKKLKPWLSKEGVDCFRTYDADLPEYAAAIDVYQNNLHIQEYQAPKTVDSDKAQKRFRELVNAAKQVFGIDDERVFIKIRKRNRGNDQYQKQAYLDDADFISVQEGKAKLLVNLKSYLDTGLFLDHRPLRSEIETIALGKRFLNLFSYTSSASVRAILGGATSSVSVDMSNTYNRWSRLNFEANNIGSNKHQIVRADVNDWLKSCRTGFDLIMLDPPSFSNSKKMDKSFDVQRDHEALVKRCMEILSSDGILFFSNNFTKFQLAPSILDTYHVEDITQQTIAPDFARNKKIHCCFKIEHKRK